MKSRKKIKNPSNKNPFQDLSDDFIMNEVRALRIGYGMKRTLRYNSKRDLSVHSESVAEHIFALHFLALYFIQYEDPDCKLDFEVVSRIITFHDFGEILHGDVPYHMKTEAHRNQEHKDAEIVFASLPVSIQKTATESWQDYEKQVSAEAKFVYALDKVEPLFELFDPVNELSLKKTNFSYKDHFDKKFLATESFPIMRRFVEVVSKDMLDRKIFWENK